MKLCVTGGAGFLGSRFVQLWLAGHPGDSVIVLDLLTYAGSRERLAEAEAGGRCTFVEGDVCDGKAMARVLEGCGWLVHCAAETHVDRSITSAAPFLRTNVEGTCAVLDAARTAGVTRVLHVSTDEVYGPVLSGVVDEQAPLSPSSPYAASKAAGDLLAQAFRSTYGLASVIVRPTNIFGPFQSPEKFIPLCIVSALERRPIPVYGDGNQRRAWLFIDDLCAALAAAIERGAPGEIYNIGSGLERGNLETARAILVLLGAPESLLQHVDDRPGHDRRYAMDDRKLRALGWQPAVAFEAGLAATVRWYEAHAQWWRRQVRRLREDSGHWLDRTAWTGA
jgi:dTDP-glucose 4,6-dehydratase